MKVVVTSNCQTAGIANGLTMLLPGADVSAVPAHDKYLQEKVDGADVWVTSSNNAQSDKRVVRIPEVHFKAWHPDMCYAVNVETNAAVTGVQNGHYQSALTLWGYTRGLSVDRTAGLFREETYEALGFMDRWAAEVAQLRARFASSDVAFADFTDAVSLHQPFMHTVNHPRVEVLAALAKCAAANIADDRSLLRVPIERVMVDALGQQSVWSVYPEIAHRYGTTGAYVWRIGASQVVASVREFVELQHAAYAAQGLKDFRSSQIDGAHMDKVIKPQ